MAVRARPLFPALALLLAVASIIPLSVALPGPAGAVVSADPDDGTCDVNDGRVNAVVYLGGTVYLGGSFTQVDGQTRNRLAACDAVTGNLLSWNPNANGVVRALKVSPAGTRVYVGGDFDSAEGAGRRHLAAFNATSGNLTSLKPTISNGTGNFATVLAMDVSADGNTLYFAGDFALVNGSSRRNAAAVSSGVGTLRAWSPPPPAGTTADLTVSASGNTVFVGGRASGGYVQAYGPNVGGTPVWNVGTNGDVEALAVSSSILYVGGQFTSIGGGARGHLAALRTSGGSVHPWNPGANGVFGAFGAAITSSRVAFGGEFTQAGGEAHLRFVQFSGTP